MASLYISNYSPFPLYLWASRRWADTCTGGRGYSSPCGGPCPRSPHRRAGWSTLQSAPSDPAPGHRSGNISVGESNTVLTYKFLYRN